MPDNDNKNAQQPEYHETTLHDVKQLGLWAAIGSLGCVFWVVGGMEIVERLSFYGVKAVSTIYATRPESKGGLGVTMATFGWILLSWNFIQSTGSIITGGLSDRYGYKLTIFISTVTKIAGFLIMAIIPTYWGFFAGAILLAAGTAIFKPAIQGSVVKATSRRNSSVGWGLFYQMVNIGGWIGPLIAMQVRQIDVQDGKDNWSLVFYTNAGFICLNFLLLLTYREPDKSGRIERRRRKKLDQESLFDEALKELRKPHLLLYLAIFSVWWFMFPMLWDVLPRYVEDWVDTRVIVKALFGEEGVKNGVLHFLLGLSEDGTAIEPEGIVNINAGMIMLTCFLFAGLGARLRATTSMMIGTVLITSGLFLFGITNIAWFALLAMVLFSAGEMLASPKFSEFIGNIAPPEKKAMWMGFSQAPMMIGMTIEGKVGPDLYYLFSSKDHLARELLVEKGLSPDLVTEKALPGGEAFSKLVEYTGTTPEALTKIMYEQNCIGLTWYIFVGFGILSAVLIFWYGRWIRKIAGRESAVDAV